MTSNELRERFLHFFEDYGHSRVPSSPLVPGNDPTLLFTNAGMVPFKDVFLGTEKRPYRRATSSQKCVRAGGKHNDLENVGYTARHHTFFEMLGNFSFGDYFKAEAIAFAWEFITAKDWLGIDPARLLVTVHESDGEAAKLWKQVAGLPEGRIVRIGDGPDGGSDNFWQMADSGPCGPCSEIFYDHGDSVAGGPPGSVDTEGDRWVEIWNLVFMQYNRAADGTLSPLPKPSVDTGMGLERLAAVLQGTHDNYETDLFRSLIAEAAKLAGRDDLPNSLKVVADHIRAAAFLIADGVLPANEGRGYVLRRIIRRALRHGWKLDTVGDFFWRMVGPLAREMGDAYPQLRDGRSDIEGAIRDEEKRFAETLDKGMALLEDAIERADGKVIAGASVFKLYDTFGFPVDLTADIARERGLTLDLGGYEAEMAKQRDRARAASTFKADYSGGVSMDAATEFTGYDHNHHEARIVALLRDGQAVDAVNAGDEAVVVLDRTPFYAEAGGQVGDTGVLSHADPDLQVDEPDMARTVTADPQPKMRGERVNPAVRGGPAIVFRVRDTQALPPDARGHLGLLESGALNVGDVVRAEVDWPRRIAVMRNHSATHLLHAALRRRLGTHVTQKGSLVAPDRLRFDFSHAEPVAPEDLEAIEMTVNAEILSNVAAAAETCGYQEAIDRGVMALFGEKYGDTVRVMRFGDFSAELCGGTHVARTGDIGLFKVLSESGVAAGVRRIEAVTGDVALAWLRATDRRLGEAAVLLRANRGEVPDKVRQLQERARKLEKELADLRGKLAAGSGRDLASEARDVGGVRVLSAQVDGADPGALRGLLDQLKQKLGSGVIVLGSAHEGKVALIAGVTDDLTKRIKAGDLVKSVAAQVGGKGGGRPDMAQAGGTQPENLEAALASVEEWVRNKSS